MLASQSEVSGRSECDNPAATQMKDIGPDITAVPDDDDLLVAPPPKPPATATVAGMPTRLVELPAFTPPEDDLLHLAFKAAMADAHLCRLTPVMLEGVESHS